MSRAIVPVVESGSEFAIAVQARAKAAASVPTAVLSKEEPDSSESSEHTAHHLPPFKQLLQRFINLLKKHKLGTAAVILLIIGAAAIQVYAHVWTTQHVTAQPAAVKTASRPPISGFNKTVPADQFQSRLQAIIGQSVTLTVGGQTVLVSSDTIKSWLQITANKDKTEYYLHVNEAKISQSLTERANHFAKAPVNQVSVSEDGASRVIVGGRNGMALSDPNTLKTQASQVAKTVMDSKGMQFNTPLQTVPFAAVGPEAFPKLLVSDINTKKMWAYQNGKQVNSWLISAGAPATPTPIGQFKIYARFSVQDMRGNNPNGTPYFQPHVRWISYFYQGSAVHGVYWHDRSWFGVHNSSHGCIGLPEDQAKWVYDWAPIGTTVITHT